MKAHAYKPDDLVTLAEAARRLGLSNLSNYKRKYETFPQPKRSEHPQLWAWGSIEAWYESSVNRRGKTT